MKSKKTSNIDVIMITFMLYGQLLLMFFDFGKNNVLTVKLAVIIMSFIYFLLQNKLTIKFKQTPLFIYWVGFSFLLLINYFFLNLSANIFLKSISTYFVCILLLFYFFSFTYLETINIIQKIIKVIVFIFLIQLIGSFYESYVGNYLAFGEFSEIKDYANWQSRLIVSESLSFFNPFNFSFPLSGFLGQHNYWGGQLPFYNLLVLKLLADSRKQKYNIIVALILLAAFLNTSRFAIVAILITDILFYVKIYKKNYFLNGLILISLLLFIYILPKVITILSDNFYRADTFSYRVNNYSAITTFIYQIPIQKIIIGFGLENLDKTYLLFMGFIGNFESEILIDFVAYGIVGLLILFVFWLKLFLQFIEFSKNKIFGFLLLLNIILVSITVNGISYHFIAPFVTLFYIYIVSSENVESSKVNH
jgi:hypothetical protein